MYDDGLNMDGAAGDGVYGAPLPTYNAGALVDDYVGGASSAAAGGAMTFFPRTAEGNPLTVQLPVVPGSGASLQIAAAGQRPSPLYLIVSPVGACGHGVLPGAHDFG